MAVTPKKVELQVRTVRFLPQNVETEPAFPSDLRIDPTVTVVFAQPFGQSPDGGRAIDATAANALKVAAYGSGFDAYAVLSGTAPASFSAVDQLAATTGTWHRFDILVESQELEIRFYQDRAAAWGDAIPLPVGYHSIEFTTTIIQVRKRVATAGTYQITAYQ